MDDVQWDNTTTRALTFEDLKDVLDEAYKAPVFLPTRPVYIVGEHEVEPLIACLAEAGIICKEKSKEKPLTPESK